MLMRESEIMRYLKDIKKINVLNVNEEEGVIQRVKDGDKKAVDELICANLRFVITIAKEYQNQGLDFIDLISEGNFGLIKAAKRFDPTVGVRFYSYAVWWVRQSIMQALNEHSRTIRLPVNIINDISKNRKEMNEIDFGNWCDKHGVIKTQSLHQEVNNEGLELIDNLIGDYNDAFKKESGTNTLSESLKSVMSILTVREREIIKQYYGLDGDALTLQQISEEIGLTKERVRQIKNQAIKKLRFNAPLLFKFFEKD